MRAYLSQTIDNKRLFLSMVRPMRRLKLLVGLANRPYALYVLLILMIVFLLNQTDRFILGVCSEEISRDLQFGERECLVNQSGLGYNVSCDTNCHQWKSSEQ